MYYKGNKQRCEDYNALVSFNENFKSLSVWCKPLEIEGSFYIQKHPNYEGAYLAEVLELPTTELP